MCYNLEYCLYHQIHAVFQTILSLMMVGKRKRKHQHLDDGTMSRCVADATADPASRPWSELPPELLSLIANRLRIIELLSFRGVCKSWRSAASTASADLELEIGMLSFIVYSEQDNKCSLYYKTGVEAGIGRRMYRLSIPELENASCLASNDGWLLLYQQGSLFFFCPFSRARIDLPELPETELSNHVAAFSVPPTSPKCIVSVVNRCDDFKVKLYVLCRGARAWTTYVWNSERPHLCNISAAYHSEESSSFYFVDNNKRLLEFSVKEETWAVYRIVMNNGETSLKMMPFAYRTNYFSSSGMKTWMELQDDVSISICGTRLPGQTFDNYACHEKVDALNGSANSQLKGIWIHARFLQIPENQVWSL